MRKFLTFFVLGGLFFGMVLSVEEYLQFLSLASLSVEASDPRAEELFWRHLESEELRYWPLFFITAADRKNEIEREAPVSILLDRKNISGFHVTIEPLKPWIVLKWRENAFYLAQDGRLWSVDHPFNSDSAETSPIVGPHFRLADDLPSPAGGDMESSGVTSCTFPVSFFKEWTKGLEEGGWSLNTEEVVVSRREGNFLIRVKLNEKGKIVQVLLRGDQGRWKEMSSAVTQILQQLHFSVGDLIIDTTYSDRIIVRTVIGGG